MESEESTEDSNNNKVEDYARQSMSNGRINDKKALITRERLEVL